FFTLLPVAAGNDPCNFPHFLCKLSHIGKFVKVSYPVFFYPFIYCCLCILYIHYSLFLESIKIVTGPSFKRATFISAPKIPASIFFPRMVLKRSLKASYNGTAISGFAALI